MEIEKIEEMLVDSLEDYVMSRKERKDFRELMSNCKGDSKRAAMVRSLAFRLAKDKVEESHQVMDWLENVIKVIYWFSPGTDCLNAIRSFISEAKESLDICVFTITDNRIVEKIEQAKARGVKIRLVADDDKSLDLGADVLAMQKRGIPTVFDVTDAHMHHKFAIADRKRLLSGSYNWTRAAERENNENVVVTNEAKLVHQFQGEFDKLWGYLKPLQD